MPLFISFWVVFVCNLFLSYQVIKQSRTIKSDALIMSQLSETALGAITFANAMADRGITIPCDDCGNQLTPDDAISVIRKTDGAIYVGHASHERHIDWGYK